jgi:hypothetical protein
VQVSEVSYDKPGDGLYAKSVRQETQEARQKMGQAARQENDHGARNKIESGLCCKTGGYSLNTRGLSFFTFLEFHKEKKVAE